LYVLFFIFSVVHLQTAFPPPNSAGAWRKKLFWKPRWVQEVKADKKFRLVWRKVWAPVEIREWIPVSRPPPIFEKPEVSGPPHNDISSYPPAPLPDDIPSFKPIGPPPTSPPFSSYGPPSTNPPPTSNFVNKPPSTALHPVSSNTPPSWPSTNADDLLSNYHTIKEPSDSMTSSGYHVASPDPERQILSQVMHPPSRIESFSNDSVSFQDPRSNDGSKGISPYARNLAEAVLREKYNQQQLQSSTERPSGLTDVVYRPQLLVSVSSPKPSFPDSSTERPKVFVVTPVSLV